MRIYILSSLFWLHKYIFVRRPLVPTIGSRDVINPTPFFIVLNLKCPHPNLFCLLLFFFLFTFYLSFLLTCFFLLFSCLGFILVFSFFLSFLFFFFSFLFLSVFLFPFFFHSLFLFSCLPSLISLFCTFFHSLFLPSFLFILILSFFRSSFILVLTYRISPSHDHGCRQKHYKGGFKRKFSVKQYPEETSLSVDLKQVIPRSSF